LANGGVATPRFYSPDGSSNLQLHALAVGSTGIWLCRPFAVSPPGSFAPWLIRPRTLDDSPQGAWANQPGGERAMGRKSQGANRLGGETAKG